MERFCKLITAAIATFALLGLTVSVPSGNGNRPNGLEELVTVDNVTFFADGITFMNWTDGRHYCNASGLELASIRTKDQADLVANALWEKYESQLFWTSGRDSREPESLEWDGTKLHPDMSIFASFRHPAQNNPDFFLYFCTWVLATPDGLHLGVNQCYNDLPVICET